MNTKAKIYVYCVIAAIAVMIVLQGCNLQEFIRVDAPKDVTNAIQYEAVNLANAQMAWDDWCYYVQSNTERFEAAVASAEERYAVLHSFLSIGMQMGGEASQGIPYGGLLFGALTGLAGLAMPQPKMLQKKDEKKKSE